MSDPLQPSFAWPTEVASRVKFLEPRKKRESRSTTRTTCSLHYDDTVKILELRSDESGDVLDTILVDDLIGATLAVELKLDSYRAIEDERETEANAEDPDRASNEPASDALIDRHGHASMTLFVYPRQTPKTWAQRCFGMTSSKTESSSQTHSMHNTTTTESHTLLPKRFAQPRTWIFAPTEDLQDAQSLVSSLRQLATGRDPNAGQPRYLVIANPKSGPKRNGDRLASTSVIPMLEAAGIDCDLMITNKANHAKDYIQQATLSELLIYQGCVLIGGDGSIHEVLNGLWKRSDKNEILAKWTFGVVGCGTSNGFATSLTYAAQEHYGWLQETFFIAKGKPLKIDVSEYQSSTRSYVSFLSFSWAMIADMDIDSECIRFMGEERFTVWGVLKVLQGKTYRARLSYLPPSSNTEIATLSSEDALIKMPALAEAVDTTKWTVIEDDFILFWASHVSHAAMHTMHSPSSTIQDGVLTLLIVRGKHVSRFAMAMVLLGLENGGHYKRPEVEVIPCRAYRLEPLVEGSYNDLDGEVVESGPIQAKVLPMAVSVFGTNK